MDDYSHLHDNKDICDNKCTQNISKVTRKLIDEMMGTNEFSSSSYNGFKNYKCGVEDEYNYSSDHQHRRLRMNKK